MNSLGIQTRKSSSSQSFTPVMIDTNRKNEAAPTTRSEWLEKRQQRAAKRFTEVAEPTGPRMVANDEDDGDEGVQHFDSSSFVGLDFSVDDGRGGSDGDGGVERVNFQLAEPPKSNASKKQSKQPARRGRPPGSVNKKKK